LQCPELAMLEFHVKDFYETGKNMPLAHAAIPFTSLCTGKYTYTLGFGPQKQTFTTYVF